MDENIKYIIKNNAFYGYRILIDENMGFIKCPKIDDINENLLIYISLVNRFIATYEDDKEIFYETIFSNDQNIQEFASMVYFFFETEQIKYSNGKLFFNKGNFIDDTNICLLMEALRVIHHLDKKDDDYKPANKIAAEMIARAKKLKREVESKIKNKDGVGFLEISSAVSARHSSINPSNIGQLNYYQIIDQYKRLMMIDDYIPCLYGNATEEYAKKVKHYSVKIINE